MRVTIWMFMVLGILELLAYSCVNSGDLSAWEKEIRPEQVNFEIWEMQR